MFTGIIEEMGRIERIQKGAHSAVLTIRADKVLEGSKVGDSIAVNGVCLTATSISSGSFTADVMHETLNRSSLAKLKSGSRVNLERAMAADGRFGGHIVAGHVDGTGIISRIEKDDNAVWYYIDADAPVMRYVVEKGSIAIDGISLTVARVSSSGFAVSIIPHTAAETTLSLRKTGDIVNLETDIIGRYIEKLMMPSGGLNEGDYGRGTGGAGGAAGAAEKTGGISKEFLLKNGF